ncbi:hypothetical protein R1flu_013011 [Riccia fluitans]|uniref:Uncharacterized protein n=1 Tax=Riccia fluitans TaxID=41844 RepID=A0ABD1ZEQ4_9MARC
MIGGAVRPYGAEGIPRIPSDGTGLMGHGLGVHTTSSERRAIAKFARLSYVGFPPELRPGTRLVVGTTLIGTTSWHHSAAAATEGTVTLDSRSGNFAKVMTYRLNSRESLFTGLPMRRGTDSTRENALRRYETCTGTLRWEEGIADLCKGRLKFD